MRLHRRRSFGWCVLLAVIIVAMWSGPGFAATASWDAVVDPELQGYNLYRAPGACATPGAFAKVNTYGVVTSGPVANPTANGIYCHKITAFNPAGESIFSNTVEFKYVLFPPAAPQNLSVK